MIPRFRLQYHRANTKTRSYRCLLMENWKIIFDRIYLGWWRSDNYRLWVYNGKSTQVGLLGFTADLGADKRSYSCTAQSTDHKGIYLEHGPFYTTSGRLSGLSLPESKLISELTPIGRTEGLQTDGHTGRENWALLGYESLRVSARLSHSHTTSYHGYLVAG